MLDYLPELTTLRRFADRTYWLFDAPKDFHQASCRRALIVRDPAFPAVPELAKALDQLDEERFPKLMAYLSNPVCRRVRTNNHVERTNRTLRFDEKVRYKFRSWRSLDRFLRLRLDRWARPAAPVQTRPAEAQASSKTRPTSAPNPGRD